MQAASFFGALDYNAPNGIYKNTEIQLQYTIQKIFLVEFIMVEFLPSVFHPQFPVNFWCFVPAHRDFLDTPLLSPWKFGRI